LRVFKYLDLQRCETAFKTLNVTFYYETFLKFNKILWPLKKEEVRERGEPGREPERERQKETGRERDRERERKRERQGEKERERQGERERE